MKNLLNISGMVAIGVGGLLVIGGVWGIVFTYQSTARENITTSVDSAIPEKPVRGPLTLKAQADVIRQHTLKTTEGQTYAEMPRQVPLLDENGDAVLDADGNAVLTTNTTRDMWVTATTLMTALNLGILAYAFFSLIVLFGIFSVWIGIVFRALSQRGNFS